MKVSSVDLLEPSATGIRLLVTVFIVLFFQVCALIWTKEQCVAFYVMETLKMLTTWSLCSKKALILLIALKEVTIFMLSLLQKFMFLIAETIVVKEVCSVIF